MYEIERKIHGRVLVTYLNPLHDTGSDLSVSSIAYNSQLSQVANNKPGTTDPYGFALYDNDLSGNYHPYTILDEVGWSATLPNSTDIYFMSINYFSPSGTSNPYMLVLDTYNNVISTVNHTILRAATECTIQNKNSGLIFANLLNGYVRLMKFDADYALKYTIQFYTSTTRFITYTLDGNYLFAIRGTSVVRRIACYKIVDTGTTFTYEEFVLPTDIYNAIGHNTNQYRRTILTLNNGIIVVGSTVNTTRLNFIRQTGDIFELVSTDSSSIYGVSVVELTALDNTHVLVNHSLFDNRRCTVFDCSNINLITVDTVLTDKYNVLNWLDMHYVVFNGYIAGVNHSSSLNTTVFYKDTGTDLVPLPIVNSVSLGAVYRISATPDNKYFVIASSNVTMGGIHYFEVGPDYATYVGNPYNDYIPNPVRLFGIDYSQYITQTDVHTSWLEARFAAKLLRDITITFDLSRQNYAVDFDVYIETERGETQTIAVRGNTELIYRFTQDIPDVNLMRITIYSMAIPAYPATITELGISSIIIYENDRLISADVYEELSYQNNTTTFGSISANEVDVSFDNSNRDFYFNNQESLIANQLKKNRKIEVQFGQEINGVIDWKSQGIFWSYNWTVPVSGLIASVTGFDTIGLLNTQTFEKHLVYTNNSVGSLIELILEDAKILMPFIEYSIDPDLFNTIIPYAWFERASYTSALKRVASSGLVDIFCDKNGTIIASPTITDPANPVDTWSQSTSIFTIQYPTVNAQPKNAVYVYVTSVFVERKSILQIKTALEIEEGTTQTYLFSSPYIANEEVNILTDRALEYTYEIYSWGIIISFVGSGEIRSIDITADSLTYNQDAVSIAKNEQEVLYEGENPFEVKSLFIQSLSKAQDDANRILTILGRSRYAAEVEYRGSTELQLNDIVEVTDGIAPGNNYYILEKNTLYWDGTLRGTASIKT